MRWPAPNRSSHRARGGFRKSSRMVTPAFSYRRGIPMKWPPRWFAFCATNRRAGAWARPDSRGSAHASPWSGWSPRQPPFTPAWSTKSVERTFRRPPRSIELAGVHHPDVTEREIVLRWIVRIEAAERCCDLGRHRPTGTGISGQPEAAPDPDDVCVERDDQLRG